MRTRRYQTFRDELKIDVEDMLGQMGMKNVFRSGEEVFFSCPFGGHKHGDQSQSTSFKVDARSPWKTFNCFGCGSHGGADNFVAQYYNVSVVVAREWLREAYGTGFREATQPMLERLHEIWEAHEREADPPRLKVLPEEVITSRAVDWYDAWERWEDFKSGPGPRGHEVSVPAHAAYMFKRGFLPSTLHEWEVGYDPISGMVCIPYRDEEGRLVALKGRAWWEDAKPKYIHLGNKPGRESRYDFDTCDIGLLIFGEHMARRTELLDPLPVCEGELNTISMWQKGFASVGFSGQFLSATQVRRILGVSDDLILVFDDFDKALRAAVGDVERGVPGLEEKARVKIALPRERDPADSTKTEIKRLLGDAKASTLIKIQAKLTQ